MTTSVARSSSLPAHPPRFDPLSEFNRPPVPGVDAAKAARVLFGAVLLAAGVGVVIWLVVIVHQALTGPAEFGLLRRLWAPQPGDLVLTLPQGNVELPPALVAIAGYFIQFLLLAVIGRTAVALIQQGASLLRPDPADKADERRATAAPGDASDVSRP